GSLYDLFGRRPARRAAAAPHVHPQRTGRRPVGLYPRLVQGQVEYQRNPVHPDDELHRHPDHQLFCGPMGKPPGSNSVGVINPQTKAGWFPEIFGQMYTLNVIIVLALAVLMFIYLNYSKQGYEIAVVGESENTARYAAMSVPQVIMRTMVVSGAVCGIAGFLAV